MSAEQTSQSQETGNKAPTTSNEANVRASFTSVTSTASSFYCEKAAEVEGRPRRPDPRSVEEWTKNSDAFEAPEQDSPSKVTTRVDRSASINTATHVDLLSPSKSSSSKKTESRKVTPPNPTLSSPPEQFETGPWSPVNPPPTPNRTSRAPGTPRIARTGTNI